MFLCNATIGNKNGSSAFLARKFKERPMKHTNVSVLVAALFLMPGAGASAASITYGGVPIVKDSDVDLRFQAARETCSIEASTPIRGTTNIENFYYGIALKSCLYRLGYFGDGSYVYPVPLYGQPSRSR
jgi:hypothetical protein